MVALGERKGKEWDKTLALSQVLFLKRETHNFKFSKNTLMDKNLIMHFYIFLLLLFWQFWTFRGLLRKIKINW